VLRRGGECWGVDEFIDHADGLVPHEFTVELPVFGKQRQLLGNVPGVLRQQ